MRVNTAAGDFYYETSTIRNKENIRPLEDDYGKFLGLEPKSYTDKISRFEGTGYIAEDLDAAGLTNLVTYENGGPNGIKYERLSLYLIEAMKVQNVMIEELKAQIDEIKNYSWKNDRIGNSFP